ncbi:MAG: hypothetical protein WC617_16995 [Rhodanobacter sp.]
MAAPDQSIIGLTHSHQNDAHQRWPSEIEAVFALRIHQGLQALGLLNRSHLTPIMQLERQCRLAHHHLHRHLQVLSQECRP